MNVNVEEQIKEQNKRLRAIAKTAYDHFEKVVDASGLEATPIERVMGLLGAVNIALLKVDTTTGGLTAHMTDLVFFYFTLECFLTYGEDTLKEVMKGYPERADLLDQLKYSRDNDGELKPGSYTIAAVKKGKSGPPN